MARQAGTKQQRTRLSPEDRRAQILDVTIALVRTNTLDKVDAALIGKAAGVSRSLVFHYFPSTRELHLAVLERTTNEMLDHIRAGVLGGGGGGGGDDGTGAVAGGVRAFIEFVAGQPSTYATLASFAAQDREFAESFDRVRGAGVELLRSGRGDRPLSQLQIGMLHGWVAMVESVTVQWIDDPSASLDDVVNSLVSVASQIVDMDA